MYFIRNLFQDPPQKVDGDNLGGLRVQLGKGQLTGAVNGHEQIPLAFCRLHLGEIEVQIVQGVVLKRRFFGLRPLFARWQAADAVALQAAVQRRATQVRDGFLKRVEAIIKGQQGLLAKQDDGGFFRRREHGGGRFGAAHGLFRRGTATPLGHRFGIDTETGG